MDVVRPALDFGSRLSPGIGIVAAGSLALAVLGCGGKVVAGGSDPEAAILAVEREDREPLGIPPADLPPPGECRLWLPGRPPERQAAPGPCARIERQAPGGAWVLFRPDREPGLIHVRVIDPRRPGVVLLVRVYDAQHGTYLRRERP